ncbi:MAG TPA: c-type cytochrome [Vicinamibacterales bacterium]|nr:c-type cytochrome [Vicinamibacterales bacterium]
MTTTCAEWAFAVVATLCLAGVAAAQAPAYSPADAQDGERLFMNSCANCHGPDGDVVPGVDLEHGQFRRASSDGELIDIIRRGIPGTAMPPGNYSNTAATQIVAFLRTQAASRQATVARGDARRGRALFEGKGQCLTCHSVNGEGPRLGIDISEVGRIRRTAELEKALLDPAPTVRPQNRGVRLVTRDGQTVTGRLLNHDMLTVQVLDTREQLRTFATRSLRELTIVEASPKTSYRGKLTPDEIADLVGYLATLKGTGAAR